MMVRVTTDDDDCNGKMPSKKRIMEKRDLNSKLFYIDVTCKRKTHR